MSDLATGTCLLFVGCDEQGAQNGLRQNGRVRNWLMLDVELIEAENGPWVGAAMPGSPNGCGIFAGAESREFRARCDTNCIYLSATLDQLLSANRIRGIFLVGEAPASFVDGVRIFAITHGYEFRVGPPDRHRVDRRDSLCAGRDRCGAVEPVCIGDPHGRALRPRADRRRFDRRRPKRCRSGSERMPCRLKLGSDN